MRNKVGAVGPWILVIVAVLSGTFWTYQADKNGKELGRHQGREAALEAVLATSKGCGFIDSADRQNMRPLEECIVINDALQAVNDSRVK